MTARIEGMHPTLIAIFYVLVLAFTMFGENMGLLLLSFVAAAIFSMMISGTKGAGKMLLFYLVVIALVSISNPLFSHQGDTVLFHIGKTVFTLESMLYGMRAGVMIVTVMEWCRSLSVLMTTERFMFLMGRRFPKIALVLSMTIHFIPGLKRQYRKSHGLREMMYVERKESFIGRIREAASEMDGLLSWSFENSIETADSMMAREYGTGKRTNYTAFRFRSSEWVELVITVFCGLIGIFFSVAEGVLYFLPLILVIRERLKWNYLESRI